MSSTLFYLRNGLHRYDQFPEAVRRLDCSRRALRQACGEEPEIPEETKRLIMVERVARELFENLLFTDSDNPMVSEVQQALDREFSEPLSFQYLPGETDLAVMRETGEGPREVNALEKENILERAWKITLAKVDETML